MCYYILDSFVAFSAWMCNTFLFQSLISDIYQILKWWCSGVIKCDFLAKYNVFFNIIIYIFTYLKLGIMILISLRNGNVENIIFGFLLPFLSISPLQMYYVNPRTFHFLHLTCNFTFLDFWSQKVLLESLSSLAHLKFSTSSHHPQSTFIQIHHYFELLRVITACTYFNNSLGWGECIN
jgi:hypothetical protein